MSRSGALLSAAAVAALVIFVAWVTLRSDAPSALPGTGGTKSAAKTKRPAEIDRGPAVDPRGGASAGPVAREPVRVDPTSTTGRAVGVVLLPGGLPAVGVRVYSAPPEATALLTIDVKSSSLTGPDGGFALILAAGKHDIIALESGHLPLIRPDVEIAVGAEVDLKTLRLDAGVALTGEVVDTDGRPVSRAVVTAYRDESLAHHALVPGRLGIEAWGGRAETDEEGRFSIGGLTVTPVLARAFGLGLEMVGEPPRAVPGSGNVRLVVRRLRLATGRVVAEDGRRPVPGATVRLEFKPGGGAQIVKTLEDGRFAFDLSAERFASAKMRYDLLVTADGFEDAARTDLPFEELKPEADLLVPLVKAAAADPGRLRGRVVYDTGAPFVGTLTLTFSRKGRAGQVHRVRTDESGEFLLEGVPSGEYVLSTAPHRSRVLRDTGRTLVIPPGGEESTEFTVPRGGDLEVKVVSPSGAAPKGAIVHLIGEDGKAADSVAVAGGIVVFPDLPPGAVRVKVTAPGFAAAEATGAVEKDRTTPLTIRMEEQR